MDAEFQKQAETHFQFAVWLQLSFSYTVECVKNRDILQVFSLKYLFVGFEEWTLVLIILSKAAHLKNLLGKRKVSNCWRIS